MIEKFRDSLSKLVVLAETDSETMTELYGDLKMSDICNVLQDLLLEEYRQRDVYESYRYMLFGPSGIPVKEHLEEHMNEEMEHVDILQRYIVSLNEVPVTKRLEIPAPKKMDLEGLMELNLELENLAVSKYSAVTKALEKLNHPAHVALINDIQTIVSQEQEHVHDLERWLREGF